MVKILISILLLGLVAIVDGKSVFLSKDFKKIGFYSIIYLTASFLCILLLIEVKIPNPMEPVNNLFVSIFGKD